MCGGSWAVVCWRPWEWGPEVMEVVARLRSLWCPEPTTVGRKERVRHRQGKIGAALARRRGTF